MSAICGVYYRDGQPAGADALSAMMSALAAYGPDGTSVWREGEVALGHQMLYLTPESLQEQVPWQDGESRCVITADARLDNREGLWEKLAIAPEIGRLLSDSQLILRAYQRWGDQCPRQLLGDFAFVIWNPRQQTLFCARDIFGVKPFFYHSAPQHFLFASDLNALLATHQVPDQLNELLLAAYLEQADIIFAQKSLTFYEAIQKLPPAHTLTLSPTTQRLQRYWHPDQAPKIHLGSEAAYVEQLRELLDQAVRCRLRSAFPVGAHLSGGLDSSAIAVTAARALQQQGKTLKGFSWSPPLDVTVDGPNDERRLVQLICDREAIENYYVPLTGQDILGFLNRNMLSEPTEMLHFEQCVQGHAHQQNVRLILSGWGGDEAITFNGRGYFADLLLRGRWWTLYQELKLRGQLHQLGLQGQLMNKVLLPILPDALAMRLEARINPDYQPQAGSAYIHPELARKFQTDYDRLPSLPYTLREKPGVHLNQQRLLEYGHLTRRTEAWAISGGMQQMVYSYPLLDRRIVEFALGIPDSLFFKHGWKRYLFRVATEGLLPDDIRWNTTKRESATVAQVRTCRQDIVDALNAERLARFRANCQFPQLSEWVDVKRLEQVLTNKEDCQTGFNNALDLVTSFSPRS